MALPDFLVAGVPKAGTTALHAALSRHPGLYMSPIKEPKFFLTDGPPPSKGGPGDVLTYREHVWQRDRYEALFDAAPPGVPRGESTPLYLYDRAALRRIRDLIPAARLIVILRDPGRAGALQLDAPVVGGPGARVGDFVRACAEEERRIAAGWASFWHYTALGTYGAQLELRVLAVPARAGARAALPAARRRAGRHAGPDLRLPRRRDRACSPRSPGRTSPRTRSTPWAIAPRRWACGPASRPAACCPAAPRPRRRTGWSGSCSAAGGNASRSSWEQRQALLPRFEDDIKLLEKVLGEDFGDWLSPRGELRRLVGARPAGQGQAKNGRRR